MVGRSQLVGGGSGQYVLYVYMRRICRVVSEYEDRCLKHRHTQPANGRPDLAMVRKRGNSFVPELQKRQGRNASRRPKGAPVARRPPLPFHDGRAKKFARAICFDRDEVVWPGIALRTYGGNASEEPTPTDPRNERPVAADETGWS